MNNKEKNPTKLELGRRAKDMLSRYNISEEKVKWLDEIGVLDITQYNFYIPQGEMYYSKEYINDTPLETLKTGHERHMRFFKPQEPEKQAKRKFESGIDREKRLRKIALEAIEACKGKNLDMLDFQRILEMMKNEACRSLIF